MKIACVTTCRGRLAHIKQTLPVNIRDCARDNVVFVLLDYNDQTGLKQYILNEHGDDLASGRLVYYHNRTAERFHMAHAKNQAHRCAALEGADILVTLDADNFTGAGFADYIRSQYRDPALSFLYPDFSVLPPKGQRFNPHNPTRLGRGFAGRLIIRTRDFFKAGGYNEVFDTWRGEDIDIIARLNRLGFKKAAINSVFLNAIAHGSKIRFSEYPEAQKYENDEIYSVTEHAHDTVVNNGRIGCGEVYRLLGASPINLERLPTRIFGIGFQRTGTTSLQTAFESLGFDSGHWVSADWSRTIWQEMNRWGRSRTLEKYQALCDNPIPILYRKLDVAYPGSKFVLTIRDEDEWIESVRQFWTYEGNPQRWTWDTDGFSHKMHSIIYGTPDFDEKIFRERYRRHNMEIISYFHGRDDLLVLNVGSACVSELCKFLDHPVTYGRFPHKNKSPRIQVKDV